MVSASELLKKSKSFQKIQESKNGYKKNTPTTRKLTDDNNFFKIPTISNGSKKTIKLVVLPASKNYNPEDVDSSPFINSFQIYLKEPETRKIIKGFNTDLMSLGKNEQGRPIYDESHPIRQYKWNIVNSLAKNNPGSSLFRGKFLHYEEDQAESFFFNVYIISDEVTPSNSGKIKMFKCRSNVLNKTILENFMNYYNKEETVEDTISDLDDLENVVISKDYFNPFDVNNTRVIQIDISLKEYSHNSFNNSYTVNVSSKPLDLEEHLSKKGIVLKDELYDIVEYLEENEYIYEKVKTSQEVLTELNAFLGFDTSLDNFKRNIEYKGYKISAFEEAFLKAHEERENLKPGEISPRKQEEAPVEFDNSKKEKPLSEVLDDDIDFEEYVSAPAKTNTPQKEVVEEDSTDFDDIDFDDEF